MPTQADSADATFFVQSPASFLTSFVLTGAKGKMLVNLDMATGKVTFGEDYDPAEAARIFWLFVAGHNPLAPKLSEVERENARLRALWNQRPVRGLRRRYP